MSSVHWKKKTMRSLRFAITKRSAEQVREVLRLRPKLRTPKGGQMLWSVMDNPEIASMLIDAGADLSERNSIDNSTFLLYASSKANNEEYLRLALLLLESGANVNFRTKEGDTALHLAVRNEAMILVEALVERGLSVDIVNAEKETAVCMAAKCSRATEMLRLMVEQRPLEKRNRRLLDAIEFLICCENDETVAIRELLNFGVDVNERSDCGLTPLSLAVARGKSNLVQMFVQFGSDMSQLMKEINLPTIRASYMEQSLLMNLLLDQGGSINIRDEYGRNRLHIVCGCSKFMPLRNVQLLLHLGADVNAIDAFGNTPFGCMDAESLNDSRQLYIKHLALLFWRGAVVTDNDMILLRNDPKTNKFYEDCLDELQRMKETVMFSEFSVFDFFVKSVEKLSMLARNTNFVTSYNEKKMLFPMYFQDLEIMFKVAVKRRDLLRLMEDVINSATDWILPICAVEKIAYYVCLNELGKLEREFYFSLHAQTDVGERLNNNMVVN